MNDLLCGREVFNDVRQRYHRLSDHRRHRHWNDCQMSRRHHHRWNGCQMSRHCYWSWSWNDCQTSQRLTMSWTMNV